MSSVASNVARLAQKAVREGLKKIYSKNTHDSLAAVYLCIFLAVVAASILVNSSRFCCCFCNATVRAQSEQTEVDKLNLQIKEVETCLNNSRMPSLGCQQQQ